MKIIILTILILLFCSPMGRTETSEQLLATGCSKGNLHNCESLAALFLKDEKWENAEILGEALCKKNVSIGCTIRGMVLLQKKKISEGTQVLNQSCDQFEPYACRSLGRFMKSSGEKDLSHVYFRRACHFGLDGICSDLQKGKKILTESGHAWMQKLNEDCLDTTSSLCKDKLHSLQECEKKLNEKDCLIIPGLLSIFFRAKLIQAEAKGLLTQLSLFEKKMKEDKRLKSYSFDLVKVLNNYKPHPYYQYVFGFKKSCSGKLKSTSLDLYPSAYSKLNRKTLQKIKKEFNNSKKQDCYDPKWGFEAFAMTSLDPLNPEHLDIWKINQDGNLIQIKDGSPIQR